MAPEASSACTPGVGGAGLPRAIGSRSEFRAAVAELIQMAAQSGARRMWWVAPDFSDWPVEDSALLDTMTAWVRASQAHRLHWIANDYEGLRPRMPRLVRWRQTWAHVLDCSAPAEPDASDLPTLLLVDDVAALQMFDTVHWRGRISAERPDLGRVREQIDALSQRSVQAFPVTTLGI